jgi:hypothetical protein
MPPPPPPSAGPAPPPTQDLTALLPSAADLLYEEELARNPYALKTWWQYLAAARRPDGAGAGADPKRRVLYERAVRALPGSYKVRRAWLEGLGTGWL